MADKRRVTRTEIKSRESESSRTEIKSRVARSENPRAEKGDQEPSNVIRVTSSE